MKTQTGVRALDYVEAPKKRFGLAVFVVDQKTKTQLEKILSSLTFSLLEIVTGDVKSATKKYKKTVSPELLIVDISGSELPLNDIQELANVCAPDVRVIVIGNRDNVGLYRNLLSHGVSDYLVKPIPPDLLHRVLERLQASAGVGVTNPMIGKSVGIYGACGGVGCTSILSNLADILSNEMHRRIMLVDMDLHQGDMGLQFGCEANNGLSELLAAPERIDGIFVERTATALNPRLDFLGADEAWDIGKEISLEAVNILNEKLRQHYHFVLCDLTKGPRNEALQIMQNLQVCILLISPSLQALKNVKKILQYLEPGRTDQRILLVLNNTRPVFKSDISRQKIEEFLGRSVDFQIPYDGKSFAASAWQDIPARSAKKKATQPIQQIVRHLVGQNKTKNVRPFWKTLPGGQRDVW